MSSLTRVILSVGGNFEYCDISIDNAGKYLSHGGKSERWTPCPTPRATVFGYGCTEVGRKYEIRFSDTKGSGLFATDASLVRGTPVTWYGSVGFIEQRIRAQDPAHLKAMHDRGDLAHYHALSGTGGWILDGVYIVPASDALAGAASFANHPDGRTRANLVGQMYAVRWRENNDVHIIPVFVLVACRDIAAGEELTYQYADAFGATPTQKLAGRKSDMATMQQLLPHVGFSRADIAQFWTGVDDSADEAIFQQRIVAQTRCTHTVKTPA